MRPHSTLASLRPALRVPAVAVAVALVTTSCGLATTTVEDVAPGQDGNGPDLTRAGASPVDDRDPGIPEVNYALPLPADSQIISPGELSAQPPVECDDPQSLAPNDSEPHELVPLIHQRGRLVVGLDQGSNLFSFRDPTTGELTGFDIDLAHEIARDIFDDPDAVEFRSLTSEERISALGSHDVDIVIGGEAITCERLEQVAFSAPYYQAHRRVLTVRGTEINSRADLEGKRVCIAGDITSAQLITDDVDNVTILNANTWADCLVAVQQNQVDAVTTDDAILAGMTEQDPYLEIVGPQIESEPYGVAIAQSSPGFNTDGLVRQVNTTLERIRTDGTWNEMYDHWLSLLGTSPGMPAADYVDEEVDDDE